MLAFLFAAMPARATNIVSNGGFEICANSTGSTVVACPGVDFAVGKVHTGSGATVYTLSTWTLASANNLKCVVVSGSANDHLCGTTWTAADGSPNLTLNTLPGNSPNGGNVFVSDGDPLYSGTLSQTINGLKANTQYILTFYQAAGEQAGQINTYSNDYWKVGLAGAVVVGGGVNCGSATQNNIAVTNGVSTAWTQTTCTFATPGSVASSGALTFLAVGPSGIPPFLFLDGVDLEQGVTAPEPGTSGLVLLGLVSLPFARKYFGKSKAGAETAAETLSNAKQA